MKLTTPQKETILLFILFCMVPLAGAAQTHTSGSSTEGNRHLKIGLALSGGGAKGFAHIGVLKVFKEAGIPVHMISGTSMGAIVGSLYATGYSPKQIEDIVLSADWNILFDDSYRINPQNISNSVSSKDTYLVTFPFNGRKLQLPSGLIDGQNISMLLYRLMLPYHDVQDFRKLPIPFSAVATDLATGKAHTFTHGYLPDAVRASSAIPTIFKPVKIDGRTYIDGGVARNIPAEDVRKLGADLVISSNVGKPVKAVDSLNTFVDILFQSVGFHQQESDREQIRKSDFYIRPNLDHFTSFSYDDAKKIIEKGEEAARKVVPEIKAYLLQHHDQLASSHFDPISYPENDTLRITKVHFSNIDGMLKRQAKIIFNLQSPARLTLHGIEKKINRLYNSGFFSQISYRLQSDSVSGGKRLILTFHPKEQQYAGFSVRYDSKYKASLLFGASLTDNLFQGDRLTTKLRIGEILNLSSEYSIPVSMAPLSHINLGLDFHHSPIDFYRQNQALSTVDVEELALRPSVSTRLFDILNLEAGAEAEGYSLNEAVGNTLLLENTNFLLGPFFKIRYNTLNQPNFPTRGQLLNFKVKASDRLWGSTSTFLQMAGTWATSLPLLKGITLNNTLFADYTSDSDIPLHYYYYLGGLSQNPVFEIHQHPFMGYAAQQLRSANILGIRSELQFRLTNNTYLTGGWNVAHLSDSWTFDLKPGLKYGYGLGLGTNTIIGPIELSISTPDFSSEYAVKIDVGYHF